MKRLFSTALIAFAIIATFGTSKPAEAQVYCGHCCGTDYWGNLVIQCTLISPVPCANACWCTNSPGTGQACY
jgi:hypothetical protein